MNLVECVDHLAACGGTPPEPAAGYARRLVFHLDGLAVRVLADHLTTVEAAAYAMAALRSETSGLTVLQ